MGFQRAADAREADNNAKGASGLLMLSAIVRDAGKEKLATEVLRKAGAAQIQTIARAGSRTGPV